MMKLKKLILFCAMLIFCCSNALAAEITCNVQNNHLEISGNLGEEYAYRMIALQMNGPFDSYTEFPDSVETVGNEFTKLDKTEFITVYLNENGEFNYSFYPKVGNRFYTVAAFAKGFDTIWNKTILNVSDALEGEVVALLNNAQSAEEIKDIFNNPDYRNILTFYYPLLRNIETEDNLNAVYEALYQAKEREPFTDLNGRYGDTVIPVSAVMNINEMSETQTEDARLIAEQNLNLETASLYDVYNGMAKNQKQNVFKRLLGVKHSDVDGFKNSFDTAIFLQMIETETFKNNLTALLNDNAAKYNIDISGYSSHVSAVNNAIYGKYFKTAKNLSDAIAAAVAEAGTDGTGGGGAGGGGSSSGSSSGGGSLPAISSQNPPTPIMPEIFDDLESVSWAKEAIEALYNLGVVSGREEKVFDPHANVKREEFVKMILLATNKPMDGDSVDFTDVDKEAWYYPYIVAGVKLGLIKGTSETSFGTGMPLTRQDMAVLIERTAEIGDEVSQEQFLDDSLISDYARAAVYRLRNAGIIHGDDENRFNPKAYATRAEAAKVIYELITRGDK